MPSLNGYRLRDLALGAWKLILKGNFRDFVRKGKLFVASLSATRPPQLLESGSLINVWSSPHTLFLADQISQILQDLEFRVKIVEKPTRKLAQPQLEIVLAPAYFRYPRTRAPRLVFQLEQTTSSRWFSKKAIRYLAQSSAVAEYSSYNIPPLERMGLERSKLFYVPLGGSSKVLKEARAKCLHDRKQDEARPPLVYGDFLSSSRRREFLEVARNQLPDVRLVNGKFGREMSEELFESSLVMNVNYYSPAILATPRLWEAISHGNQVASEKSINWKEYPELGEVVNFFDVGDFLGIAGWAKPQGHPIEPEWNSLERAVETSENRFRFMFVRALVGARLLRQDQFSRFLQLPTLSESSSIVLSLPETVERRNYFLEKRIPDAILFDGVKQDPGWVGCAKSYQEIARYLLSKGSRRAVICEDDVEVPENYLDLVRKVFRYLDKLGDEWDLFVGLVSDFDPRTTILGVEDFEGTRFVQFDRFTSTVFNIYSSRGLQRLANWSLDPERNVAENTIDRYLSGQEDLRVVALEFDVFGHDDKQMSTIWGFKNDTYSSMIEKSKNEKARLLQRFLEI